MHTQHYMMLQRNLLYTGLPRGKRLVILVGSKRALAIAMKNNATEERGTLLAERLRAAAGHGDEDEDDDAALWAWRARRPSVMPVIDERLPPLPPMLPAHREGRTHG